MPPNYFDEMPCNFDEAGRLACLTLDRRLGIFTKVGFGLLKTAVISIVPTAFLSLAINPFSKESGVKRILNGQEVPFGQNAGLS